MRKRIFNPVLPALTLAVALTLALALAACDNDTETNLFIGTWTGAGTSAGSSVVFTRTNRTLYSGTNVYGTYTYNGNSATLTNSDGGTFTASISGNTLTLVRYGLSFTFTRQ